ncbi:MAG: EAL domain-containing protein [Cyanobacteria bacterium J06643_4]
MLKKFAIPEDIHIIWEAFLSLLPVALTINTIVLLSGVSWFLQAEGWLGVELINGNEINDVYIFLIPLFFNLAFSSLLASAKGLAPISTILISMVCFIRGSGLFSSVDGSVLGSINGSVFTSIIFTWSAVRLWQYLSNIPSLWLLQNVTDISPRLKQTFKLLLPSLLTILSFEVLGHLLFATLAQMSTSVLTALAPTFANLSELQELILFRVIASSAWFVGVHGEHFSEGLLHVFYNLPAKTGYTGIPMADFHNVFMNIGGTGSTFVIPFLLLASKRLSPLKSIGQLSIVYALFNINEVLFYGLPILFNPIFLVPFFLVPFVNMSIVLFMVNHGFFAVFQDTTVHWMTMPLYNAYIVSKGSLWAVLTQLSCIFLDGLIYWPFLCLAVRQHRAPLSLKRLFVDQTYGFLDRVLNSQQQRSFTRQQQNSLREMTLIQTLRKRLRDGQLLVYYQPKVDAKTLEVIGLEALLRLQDRQGNVFEPTFLPLLSQQGLSKFIDSKVVILVFEHILRWRELGLAVPVVSINFDSDFLADASAVQSLVQQAEQSQILLNIEVSEQTYVKETAAIALALQQLRAAGHRITIDNFGTGYACLRSLIDIPAHEIKLDRQIVAFSRENAEKGRQLLQKTTQLCHSFDYLVIAEGIETEAQLKQARYCGVDILQGYYLGRPISHQKMDVFLANPVYEASN